MSSYLPPGCSNSDTDGFDPHCEDCGCLWSAHYQDDKDLEFQEFNNKGDMIIVPLNAEQDFEYNAIELDSNGEIVHSCDSLLGKDRQCECEGYKGI
jgi:hypothetical protein